MFLATSAAFVKEFLSDKAAAGKRLGDAPEFKIATAGFLKQANGLSYLSGTFFPKLARVLAAFGKADPSEHSCHAWTDHDDVAPLHWSAQGTWDTEQGTWQITDPRKTAD